MRFPRRLKPGDTIAVTSPSSGVAGRAAQRIDFCIDWLRERGFEVVVGECMDGSGITSAPAHERVVMTLRSWNIRIDESLFLGGLPKGEFLKAYGADVFFDDQQQHCESASPHVATGHVPHGVANEV